MIKGPFDVSFEIIMWLLGFAVVIAIYKIPFFNNLRLGQNAFFRTKEYGENPYVKLNTKQLRGIRNRLTTGYVAILTIYGVLLAFVIAEPIFRTVSSWYFSLWIGWILAIITKCGMILSNLFDIEETNSMEMPRLLHGAKQFFKVSIYLLILTIAVVPTFYFLTSQQNSVETQFETSGAIIIPSLAITICGAFGIFYFSIFRFNFTRIAESILVILLGVAAFGSAAIVVDKPSSPIELVYIMVFGSTPIVVTSAFYAMIRFGLMFSAIWLAIFFTLGRYREQERREYKRQLNLLEKQHKNGKISDEYYKKELSELKNLFDKTYDY